MPEGSLVDIFPSPEHFLDLSIFKKHEDFIKTDEHSSCFLVNFVLFSPISGDLYYSVATY